MGFYFQYIGAFHFISLAVLDGHIYIGINVSLKEVVSGEGVHSVFDLCCVTSFGSLGLGHMQEGRRGGNDNSDDELTASGYLPPPC